MRITLIHNPAAGRQSAGEAARLCGLLAERGHKVRYGETWSGGRLTACAREQTPEGTILKAGANPRGMQTYAAGR